DAFCEDGEWILTNSQVYSYGTLPLPEMPPVCTWVHSYGATDRMGDDWTRSQAPVTEVMSGQYPDVGLFVDSITESSFGPFDGTDAYVPTNGFGARVCPAPFERLWSWDPNEHARVIDSNTASASIWQDISVSQMHNDHQYMMVFW